MRKHWKEDAMAAPGENMRVNADRLWDMLMDMAKIGPGIAGGNNRQTLTDADAEGPCSFPIMVRGRRAHHGCRQDGDDVCDTRRRRP
ncbi:hypothetical protein QE435_003248 [Rhizobium sp. SORGH_AS 787]|nr:hypothetical protein [Rhizobium sp. SORGH_AS_0787]